MVGQVWAAEIGIAPSAPRLFLAKALRVIAACVTTGTVFFFWAREGNGVFSKANGRRIGVYFSRLKGYAISATAFWTTMPDVDAVSGNSLRFSAFHNNVSRGLLMSQGQVRPANRGVRIGLFCLFLCRNGCNALQVTLGTAVSLNRTNFIEKILPAISGEPIRIFWVHARHSLEGRHAAGGQSQGRHVYVKRLGLCVAWQEPFSSSIRKACFRLFIGHVWICLAIGVGSRACRRFCHFLAYCR